MDNVRFHLVNDPGDFELPVHAQAQLLVHRHWDSRCMMDRFSQVLSGFFFLLTVNIDSDDLKVALP